MKKLLLKSTLLLCALIAGSLSSWAADTYVKITSTSDLVVGDVYIIATSSAVATAYSSGSLTNTGAGFTESSGTITTSTATPMEFTLGKVGDNYTLKMSDNKYLGYNGSKTNFRNSQTAATATNEQWTIAYNSTYAMYTIVNVQTKTRFIGSGSGVFKVYADMSANAPATLYKKQVSTAPNVSLSATSLAFGRVKAGATKEKTFTITPSNLTGNLSIACNNAKYTVSPTSIAQSTTTATTITVTAAPTATGDNMTGTITISGGGLTENETVSLSCVVRDPAANDGTVAKPYTVAEARELIDEVGSDKTGIYVKGRISQIDEVSTTNKNATYWISDNGTTTNQLEVYRGRYIDDADFTSEDQIHIHDAVVVVGDLTKFGTTYEFAKDNYLYSLTPDSRTEVELSWSASKVEIAKGASESEYTLPSLTNTNNVSPIVYTITGTDNLAIEVDGTILVDTEIEGSVTVTASFAGDDSYKPAEASYTITVYDATVKGSKYNPYTVAEVLDLTSDKTDVYVEGYIVGYVSGTSSFTSTIGSNMNSNWAIADDKEETAFANVIPVQISGTTTQNNYGLTNHPELIGAKVLIMGNITGYFGKNGVKNLGEINVKVPVTVTSAGLATFAFSSRLDFTNVENLEAYIAKEESSAIKLHKVNKVPAGTGVLLRAKNGATDFEVPVATSADDVTDNLFVRGTGAAVESGSGPYNYVLGKHNGEVGFYKAGGMTVATDKAYLQTTISSAHIFIDFENMGVTGVNEITNTNLTNNTNGIFDLQGRKVAHPTKGLYIVNGKKVVIK